MLIQLRPVLAKCDCCGRYYESSMDIENDLSVREAIEEILAEGWAEIDGKLYCPDCYAYNADEHEVKK